MGPHVICFGLLGLLLNQSNQILYARRGVYKAIIVFAVYFIAETFSHWLALLKEAIEAVHRCKQAGVRTIMITGDHALTARAVAAQLGRSRGAVAALLFRGLKKLRESLKDVAGD